MRPACRERLSERQPESNQRRIRVESEANQSRTRGESESNQSRIRGESESNQRRIRVESEANQSRIRGESESNQSRIRGESESNQGRIRVESESNQTHRSCHAPPKQRREIPRAHRDAPYKDVGRAHLWGSKAAVVSVCMQGRWSPRRSTPAARAPPTHPHTTARAMQERAARPPRTCGEEE
jgi:hypothetical protein